MTTPAPQPPLSEMDRSRLLNELDAMPREKSLRLRRATMAGRLAESPHERSIQVALLGQMRWLRPTSAVFFTVMALLRLALLLSGRDRGWYDVVTTVILVVLAAYFTWRWVVTRRLEGELGLRAPSKPASR